MTAHVQPDPSFASYLRDVADALSRDELECPTFVDASLGARLALKNPDLSSAQVAKIVAGEPLLSARAVAYEHEDHPATLAPGSLSQILCLANRCANAPAASASEAAGGPAAAPPPGGGLDEAAAQALLTEHFDEVTWLLAAMRG